jgi:hypothetical protein
VSRAVTAGKIPLYCFMHSAFRFTRLNSVASTSASHPHIIHYSDPAQASQLTAASLGSTFGQFRITLLPTLRLSQRAICFALLGTNSPHADRSV